MEARDVAPLSVTDPIPPEPLRSWELDLAVESINRRLESERDLDEDKRRDLQRVRMRLWHHGIAAVTREGRGR